MTYTVKVVNHCLKSGNYEGTYQTQVVAEDRARAMASRSRAFCEFQACKGSPRNPGEPVGPVYRGEG